MIPLQLRLQNFLSYGPEAQTINFGHYPLICLSGKNGHGKSALLDAMTWALWGHARKIATVSKADEGLLRLGQRQMMVCFDFLLNGLTYRVRREFTLTYGKPHAALDFGILNPATQHVASLTDKTIRATQEKIEATIGLDYESFINSAFLRQGQSNEFSKKSAKERKEVLATILGLNRYEQIRTKALDKIKVFNEEKNKVLALHNHVTQELEQLAALTVQEAEITAALEQITVKEKSLFHQQNIHAQQRQQLEQEMRSAHALVSQREILVADEQQKISALRTIRNAWKSTHHQVLTMSSIGTLETQRHTLQQQLIHMQVVMQKNLELTKNLLTNKQELQDLERTLRNEHARHVQEKQVIRDRSALTLHQAELELKQNEQRSAELTTALALKEQEWGKAQKLIATIQALRSAATPYEQQFEKRKAYYQKYQAHGTWIQRELEQIAQKQQLSHDEQNPSCPLCEQNLSAARKRFLKAKCARQEQFLRHRRDRLAKIVTKLKTLLVEQHKVLTEMRTKIAEGELIERTAAQIMAERQKLQETLNELAARHEKNTAQTQHLCTTYHQAHKDYEQTLASEQQLITQHTAHKAIRTQVEDIQHQLTLHHHDPVQHQRLLDDLKSIDQQLHLATSMRELKALQEQRKNQVHDLGEQIRDLRTKLTTLAEQLEKYGYLDKANKELKEQEQELLENLKVLTHEKEHIVHSKGRLEHQRAYLAQREQESQNLKKRVLELTTMSDEYYSIATALGKDGIQALLIEEAIPEIEQEANQLLAKLTDNQAQLFIESLRDLKKGGTKETLDIKISDPAGVRPYELFSGGEAFRIDFALRIAISKLLARRAGASLQTLIIDEGFGSQDEDGLAHIMDAIHKIQHDFAKIIIVSHLSNLKEQFPVHFIVDKGAQGSTVQVVEQA